MSTQEARNIVLVSMALLGVMVVMSTDAFHKARDFVVSKTGGSVPSAPTPVGVPFPGNNQPATPDQTPPAVTLVHPAPGPVRL